MLLWPREPRTKSHLSPAFCRDLRGTSCHQGVPGSPKGWRVLQGERQGSSGRGSGWGSPWTQTWSLCVSELPVCSSISTTSVSDHRFRWGANSSVFLLTPISFPLSYNIVFLLPYRNIQWLHLSKCLQVTSVTLQPCPGLPGTHGSDPWRPSSRKIQ